MKSEYIKRDSQPSSLYRFTISDKVEKPLLNNHIPAPLTHCIEAPDTLLTDHLPDGMIVGVSYVQGALGIDIDAKRAIEFCGCSDAIDTSRCGRTCNGSDYAILRDLPDLVIIGIGYIEGPIGRHTNGGGSEELGGSADSILRTLQGRVAGNRCDIAAHGYLPDGLAIGVSYKNVSAGIEAEPKRTLKRSDPGRPVTVPGITGISGYCGYYAVPNETDIIIPHITEEDIFSVRCHSYTIRFI